MRQWLQDAAHIAMLTGAGVSAESGVPTFRDAQTGLWAHFRAEDLATQQLDRAGAALARFRDRPVCLVNIGDARHLRIFGFDSLFGSTLDRLGLRNAWAGDTAFSFLAPVPLERLADMPDARLVNIGTLPPAADRALSRSILWRALPPVAQGRTYLLSDVNAFGAVPAALRFATLLAQAFETGPKAIA